MPEAVEAAVLAVALPGGEEQRQAARRAGGQEARLQGGRAARSASRLPTKPELAKVSPSRMRATASSAVTECSSHESSFARRLEAAEIDQNRLQCKAGHILAKVKGRRRTFKRQVCRRRSPLR